MESRTRYAVSRPTAYHLVPERLWTAGRQASHAARQDGRDLFTAVTLLAWLDDVNSCPQEEVLGLPREQLLLRHDVYTVHGVWHAIDEDAGVTHSLFHHGLAVRASQLALSRRKPIQRRLELVR